MKKLGIALARIPVYLLAVVASLVAGLAWAAGERGPFDYTVLTYVWVMALSGMGGLVNWSTKRKEGLTRPFNLTEFVGELVTSSFAGLLTFWLCESAGLNQLVSAALIGISGHMGSRAIFRLERWMEQRWPALRDENADSKPEDAKS